MAQQIRETGLNNRKNALQETDVSSVDTATRHVRDLLAREMGPGRTQDSAMYRIQERYGIDYWAQWKLLYRKPKQIAADLSARIHGAWLTALEASIRRDLLRLEAEIVKAGPGDGVADLESLRTEAQALLARIQEKVRA